jgi:hypothetical protein
MFGQVVAGSMRAIGSVVAGKVAYDHYDAAFRAGKNSAQSINTVSKKQKKNYYLSNYGRYESTRSSLVNCNCWGFRSFYNFRFISLRIIFWFRFFFIKFFEKENVK